MFVIFFYFLFLISFIHAQISDKGEISYLDFNQKTTTKENATFYEFRTPYKKGTIKYQKHFIYSTTKAFLVEKYYLDDKGNKQGKYNAYFKDGVIHSKNDIKVRYN